VSRTPQFCRQQHGLPLQTSAAAASRVVLKTWPTEPPFPEHGPVCQMMEVLVRSPDGSNLWFVRQTGRSSGSFARRIEVVVRSPDESKLWFVRQADRRCRSCARAPPRWFIRPNQREMNGLVNGTQPTLLPTMHYSLISNVKRSTFSSGCGESYKNEKC
jgi:hypothetical protein